MDTKLLHDTGQPDRYLTIDTWLSRSACDAFRDRYAKEFDDLDRKCEAFTVREELIGNCDVLVIPKPMPAEPPEGV